MSELPTSPESPESPELLNGDAPMLEASPASDDLETLLARRASPRKRVLRAGLVALPVLIALAVVLRAYPTALPAWMGTGAAATATLSPRSVSRSGTAYVSNATIILTTNTITISSNVTFGTLTLNGKHVSGPLPQQLTLANGDNTFTLTAPPFATQSCTLRAPFQYSANGNPIGLGPSAGPECGVGWSSGDAGTSMVLDMQLGGNDLPAALQRSALAAAGNAVEATPGYKDSVPRGDYYATGLDANGLPISRRATEPLTAELSYSLADPATPAGSSSYGCGDLLCPGPDLGGQFTTPVWIIDVPVAQVWRFTTPSGTLAGQVIESTEAPSVLALSYDPSAGWRVSTALAASGSGPGLPPPSSSYADSCGAGMRMLWPVLQQIQERQSGLSVRPASGGQQDCQLQVDDQGGSLLGTFICRYGALLAADDGAHKLLPALPMAPPSEAVSLG